MEVFVGGIILPTTNVNIYQKSLAFFFLRIENVYVFSFCQINVKSKSLGYVCVEDSTMKYILMFQQQMHHPGTLSLGNSRNLLPTLSSGFKFISSPAANLKL